MVETNTYKFFVLRKKNEFFVLHTELPLQKSWTEAPFRAV